MSTAVMVGLLTAAAVYLFMQRGMVRIILGFVLISHAANLVLFSAGNTAYRGLPFVSNEAGDRADPLPQAFVLTAIVIAFAITMFMLTLAITTTTDDDTEGNDEAPAQVVATAHALRSGSVPVQPQPGEQSHHGSGPDRPAEQAQRDDGAAEPPAGDAAAGEHGAEQRLDDERGEGGQQ
ncbi:sodium:proton antiporter [Nesterenkonia sp.]|uniref:sodium:proton antiporter n=1 Tax=Nesterenkonia sp. TaxID=704201 RepID=UPI00260CD611|nr:cation:proton antiporter subunit C [Nesterenkonia sp.]